MFGQRTPCAPRLACRRFRQIPACLRSDTTGCIFPQTCRLPSRPSATAESHSCVGSSGSVAPSSTVCPARGEILGFRSCISGPIARRGGHCLPRVFVKADLILCPPAGIVHWSVLLLRNLQSLGNEPEHCLQHLPVLNFSETFLPSPCLPVMGERSCPPFFAVPVGSYLFIGPSYRSEEHTSELQSP